jgi:hypothetical protein
VQRLCGAGCALALCFYAVVFWRASVRWHAAVSLLLHFYAGLLLHFFSIKKSLLYCSYFIQLLHAYSVAGVRRLMHDCNAKNNKLRLCVMALFFAVRCGVGYLT